MNTPRRKKIVRWIVGSVLTLLLLPVVLLLLLQLPVVQRFMKDKAESYLQEQLKTDVHIGGLRFSWWNSLTLSDVYVGDKRKDTLLSSGELAVKYNLLALLNNNLKIRSLRWEDAVVNVYRPADDSSFNYQFVIDAFSSPEDKKDTLIEESGTTLQYEIGEVQLERIYVRYNDSLGGMLASARLASLHMLPDVLQPSNGKYYLKSFQLEGLEAGILQQYRAPAAAPPPADTGSTPFDLTVRDLSIRNTGWTYTDESSGLDTKGRIGALELRKARFDLLKTLIEADELSLEKTTASLDFLKPMDTATLAETDTPAAPNTWKVAAKSLQTREVSFSMDNHLAPPLQYKNAVDYNHLGITGLFLDVRDLAYSEDSTLVTIRNGSLKEQSGMQLKALRGKVRYTPQEARLQQFLLQTNESRIDADVRLQTESWATVSDQLGLLAGEADIRPSDVALKEALFFVPDMRSNTSLQPLWKKRLALKGRMTGNLAKLVVPGFEVKDNDHNYLYVKGTAFQVTDPDRMGADLTTITLRSTRRGIESWLPPNTLPSSMTLPATMNVNGSIRGGMQLLKPDLAVTTDLGNADIKGQVADFMDMNKIRYDMALGTQNLQLGRILGDTAIGGLNGKFTVKGNGTDPQKADVNAGVNITSFTYNRYTYTGIVMEAALDKGDYSAKGSIADSSARARFDVKGTLDTLHPAITAKADLDKFDLYATNFTTSPLTIKSCLDAELDDLSPRRLNGFAAIHKIQIADAQELYTLDSILLKADADSGQRISLTGPFGFLTASGDFNYQTFATAAAGLVTRHLEAEGTPPPPPGESQRVEFTGSISVPKNLRKLLPDISLPKPLTLNGRLDTDSSLLLAELSVPSMRYDSFRVDTLLVDISADTTQMETHILLGRLRHPQIPVQRTTVDVTAKNGLLDWNLLMGRRQNRPKYRLGGLVRFAQGDSLVISLKKDLLLNRQDWNVAGDNQVVIYNGGIAFADIGLQRGAQQLLITSSPAAEGATLPDLTVALKDFRLSTVTSLIEKDTALAEGISNGEIRISGLDQTPLIDGKLTVDSLAVMGSRLGRLALTANTTADKQAQLEATIQGNDNDLRLAGTYGEQMDIRLDITSLNMQSIESLTFGNVTNMSGKLSGKATLQGTTDKPVIRGDMHFDDVAGRITMINNYLRLPSEDLALTETGIRFNQFVIADSTGNEAVINGEIRTTDLSSFQLDFDLNAQNFMALGTQDPKNKDQFYYGPAYVDVTAQVRGTLDLPRVQMKLKLREKSQVTVMIPEEEPGIADRAGVVQFIDPAMWTDTTLRLQPPDTTATTSRLKGFVISADVEVTPESTLKLVIDQTNGDFLEVKGNATLNFSMDPSSKMSLTGRYEINEGKYAMSLNQLIKREFQIEKGSTIIWNGDPMLADVNITARYDVNAVAADLIQDQIRSDDPARNRYKQKVPVEVYL
ncbi:MAG: translocation/assembly module TamB domain-containing protein, partial [Chitinophaga sp.]